MSDYVFTDNKGKLKVLKPFNFLRGVANKGELMGQAQDEQGRVYDIFTAPCNIPTCYCYATAKEIDYNKV